MKKIFLVLILSTFFGINTVSAATIIQDTWINWPGYNVKEQNDEYGTPKIDKLVLDVVDNNLNSVSVVLKAGETHSDWQIFNSLFLNSHSITTTDYRWDDWDFFVNQGVSDKNVWATNGSVPTPGIYDVLNDYKYTTNNWWGRKGGVNGIDTSDLTFINTFSYTQDFYQGQAAFTYDFNFNIDTSKGFTVGFAPWCSNDVIGGVINPVPEPSTLLLLGLGLMGFSYGRFRKEHEKNNSN